jgi:hypothetical protein
LILSEIEMRFRGRSDSRLVTILTELPLIQNDININVIFLVKYKVNVMTGFSMASLGCASMVL